jgi:hypothetical protein
LKNETALINTNPVPAALIPANHTLEAVATGTPDPLPSAAKSGNDEALMSFCERLFAPLMQKARSPAEAGGADLPADADPEPDKARQRFIQALKAGKALLNQAMPRGPQKDRSPRRGLGPRVFIGFDAEWQFVRKGRNRVLSVQFYLVGPEGETLARVLHLTGEQAVEERPRLSQALYDLLEEALDEGVMAEWPVEVVLCGFFTRADITVFSDFAKLRPQLSGVGGSLASVGQAAQLELPITVERVEQLKSRHQFIVGDTFQPQLLSLRLIDASRLAPPGKTLAAIGHWLGLPKIELPAGYSIDKMTQFQRKEPAKFEAYGLRDAEIAVMYVLWVVWFSRRHLGLNMERLSTTASGLAVRLAEACIRRDGVALDVALNCETRQIQRWNNATDRPRAQKKRQPKQTRKWLESFLADAFVGGRNECFTFGPTARKPFYDPDLSGAYLTALGYLFVLDYDGAMMTPIVADFIGHVAGFALVQFRFPPATRFPCLPVAVEDRGLLFPLSGESLCTAPEIELAQAMGAEVEIKFGLVIPWMNRETVFARSQNPAGRPRPAGKARDKDRSLSTEDEAEVEDELPARETAPPSSAHADTGYRLFESFAVTIREIRSRFERKTLPFEFVKLLGNSVYGKTGQGFKNKRAFGPREMTSVTVGPSRISEAAIAALVTGFIRAVIGEILWKLPPEATAVSATTDGFLVDVPLAQLDLSGTMCRRFQALVDRLSPGSHMLENKHQVLQLFAGRTRLQVTCEADGNHPTVTAKGGVKPGPEVEDEDAYMIDLICQRQPGQKQSYASFISLRDQLKLGYDMQTEQRETRLNLEYDFKRQPIAGSVRMVEISGTGIAHLAFDTQPWQTAEEAVTTRLIFDKWRETHCLKTLEDFADWEHFLAFRLAGLKRGKSSGASRSVKASARSATGRRNLTRDGYVGIAKRTFLAAYQKRLWGLSGVDLSQRKLAEWLTEQGYKTSLSAVKNGTGEQPEEAVVPASPDVMTFLNTLKARFNGLEIDRFLIGQGNCPE